jgi:glycosyltransferase involved in cell wall biosynthesis
MAGAAHVLCVSSVLRDRLLEQHRIPPERITVVPCVADVEKFHVDERERSESRQALGLADRFVIVYPGRFGRWHYGPETLRVVRGLLDAFPDAYFVCLTPDLEEARRLAGSMLPEGRYRIETAKHAEVPHYLRAADLGLLLRERHPLNEAACPTKFAEYMLCGLPVLISPGIGDCSPFVANHAAGAILEEPDPVAAVEAVRVLRKQPDEARRTRIGAAGEALSRQRLARDLADLYLRLACEG